MHVSTSYGIVPSTSLSTVTGRSSPKIVTVSPSWQSMSVTSIMQTSMQMLPT